MANIFSPNVGYTYGQSTANPSAGYNIWGSTTGNPYITQGPSYTPLPPNYQPGQPIPPRQTQPVSSDGDGGNGDGNNAGGNIGGISNWQNANFWANTNFGNMPGALSGLGLLSAGINPMGKWFGWGDTYMDTYQGPGAGIADTYGIGPGEQRDMLIEQEKDFWDSQAEEAAWNAGYDIGTADTGGWDTAESFQDETGIGDSTWDSSAEGFSWDDDGGDSGGGDSGGGGSYIATATTQALGEEGLKVFEDWRDYMFNALPTFTSSFGRYRVTAPKIVEEIDKKENSKEIYKGIWDKYLKPIFDIIKTDKDSKKALKDYKVMVRELSNKYLKGVSDGK